MGYGRSVFRAPNPYDNDADINVPDRVDRRGSSPTNKCGGDWILGNGHCEAPPIEGLSGEIAPAGIEPPRF